uniref:rhodanese-like domain-containing protein n=1 Tax=Pararhizobium sp. IMCC3301 TaxID=3067904 RepID=UPI002741F7E7|nr:rhodanese-like domain-containing protein [Pararhizobium sp. IMCC3301]
MKTAQQYLDEANQAVTRVPCEQGIAIHKAGDTVFVDVRDSKDIAESGTIAGALCIPRGFIEFAADEATPHHNKALKKDAKIALVCGLGGQAALTGKTLQDMGYTAVVNVGGIGDWKKAGGPMEN